MAIENPGLGTWTRGLLRYLDFRSQRTDLELPARILELPDEVLLSIATKLEKNSDLRRLSLVNQKFGHVAQEALVKEVILPKNGIRQFLEMLCNRPDLASRIKSVDLGDYQGPGCPGRLYQLDVRTLFRTCRVLVDQINGNGHFERIVTAINKDGSALWTRNRRYFLDILVSLSPSLRDITVQMPEREIDLWGNLDIKAPDLVAPFQGLALELLQDRLRVLTISEKSTWLNRELYKVTVRSLSKLTRLTLPMDALSSTSEPSEVSTDLAQVLPPSIEHLQLRPCNKGFLQWFPSFGRAYTTAKLPRLRRLDLYFKSCLRTSLLLMGLGQRFPESFRSVVRLLSQTGVVINVHGASKKSSANLLEELDAWASLSDFEAWLAATKGEQFSAVVARTEEGAPRRRTKNEIGDFLRAEKAKWRKPLKFSPRITLHQISEPSFGKNKQPTICKCSCEADAEVWSEMLASFGNPSSKFAFSSTLSLPVIESTTEDRELKYNFEDFAQIFGTTEPLLTASSFNSNDWLEQDFFSKAELPLSKAPHARQKRGRATGLSTASKQRSSSIPRSRRLKQKIT